MVLIVDAVFLLLLAFFELFAYHELVPVNFLYPVLLCSSMVGIEVDWRRPGWGANRLLSAHSSELQVTMAFLIVSCQKCGKVTSGGMFLSWLLFVVCGLPELYWWMSVGLDPGQILSNDLPRYVAFLLWFPCVVIQLFLFSFADSPDEKQCQKTSVSSRCLPSLRLINAP
jgi:hypothetical protein